LQFQASKGLGDFPETDMSSTTGGKPILIELAEGHFVDLLTESF